MLRKIFLFFANPRLLLCWCLAWLITNGWSYIMLGFGIFFGISWMQAVAGAYLAFLWMPVTPEKIITTIIAIFFLKLFFPKDEKTLGILKDLLEKIKGKKKKRRIKMQEEKIELTRAEIDALNEYNKKIGREAKKAIIAEVEEIIKARCKSEEMWAKASNSAEHSHRFLHGKNVCESLIFDLRKLKARYEDETN